jgi:hypothetical protein
LAFEKAKLAKLGVFFKLFPEIKLFVHFAILWPYLIDDENYIFNGLFWIFFAKFAIFYENLPI